MSQNSKERFKELKETGKLPSPAGTALAIIQLTEQEDVQIERVVHLVQTDPAIAGCLLKFANASQFGNTRPIASLSKAISLLGFFRVRQLVLGIALINEHRKGRCNTFDYSKFWSQSLAAAIAAQKISPYIEAAPEESFTCGLLAEIGRLALATLFPFEYDELLKAAILAPELDELMLLGMEQEHFGIDHRGLTLCLLEDWRLPKPYLDAIEHLKNPDLAYPPLGPRTHGLAVAFRFATSLGSVCVADATTRWHLLPTLYHLGARLGVTMEEMPGMVDGVIATWQDWGSYLQVATHALPSFHEMQVAGPALTKENTNSGASQEKNNHYPIKVLLVSSNTILLQAIRNELAGNEYDIAEANNMSQALTAFEGDDAQLVICDMSPGKLDVFALPQALRQSNIRRPTYFIALLHNENEHTISRAMESGFDDYIQTPLGSMIFQARLATARRVLRLHKGIQLERESAMKNTSEWAQTNRRLLHDSLTDPLTGLPNRRYGMDRIAQESSFASASGSPLCCLMIDIDHFKAVNDSYGHDMGDHVLNQVAKILLQTIRKDDVAFRYGGEEFIVLCPGTACGAAMQLAERIRCAIAAFHFDSKPPSFHSAVSIGVSTFNPDSPDKDAMIKKADAALYQAKQAGRNRIVAAT